MTVGGHCAKCGNTLCVCAFAAAERRALDRVLKIRLWWLVTAVAEFAVAMAAAAFGLMPVACVLFAAAVFMLWPITLREDQ